YQIEPIGVVIPRHKEDVIKTVQIACDRNEPILPRGGGTSLGGQTVGQAIVIDMSKYMNNVIEVNIEERWARVQPGVVLDELNHHLKPHDLMFAPDVATSSRANVGGMIGNNSAGSHSLIYGKTVDHVMALDLVLANGEEIIVEPISLDELEAKKQGDSRESQIYREICRIVAENTDEIRKRFPRILRRVAGYNLDEFVPDAGSKEVTPYRRDGCDAERPFSLAKIVVGSEGTLATTLEAKINLVPTPKMTALNVLHFNTLIESMEAVNPILECNPSAVELIDKTILDMTKASLEFSRLRTFVQGEPGAILVVEFYGESEDELLDKLDALERKMKSIGLGYAFVRCMTAAEKEPVWETRKAGLGLLMGAKSDYKPVGFVEDAAVATADLPEYVRRFEKIVADHDTTASYYAHASVGLLHNRPIINLKKEEDIHKMHSIAAHVRDLLMELGGAMSGEHGDGLVRSEWIESMFGEQLYQAFREVKAAFDPAGIMNPGKIIDAPPMTENLRFGAKYSTIKIDTYFDFSSQGGFGGAIEMCNGVGACRKNLTGTMCPSYMATKEEEHSTRGRANVLRAVLSGTLPHLHFKSKRLYEVLDLCLECKACKAECPSNVDMAKLKYEFLAHYYKEHGLPLRNRLFGNIAELSEIGSAFAPVSNWFMNSGIAKWALDKFVGIDRRRTMPNFVRETFEKWYQKRPAPHRSGNGKQVVLFHDTFMNYNYPSVGKAAVAVLEAAGFEVILPEKRCCARPMISKGMLDQAIENARYNVERLFPYAAEGIPILGCEPSCLSVLIDDYVDLIPSQETKRVAENAFMIEEFLLACHQKGELDLNFTDVQKEILLHGHCQQKALVGVQPSAQVLSLPPGYNVQVIDSGCCGMAGSFGYEAEHYDLSMQIGDQQLFKAINQQRGDFEVAVTGISCREQVKQGTGKSARHLIEILSDALL
ncbi:MAG: anaerobic glycerol-3-phosphate dehydrogenase subunit C, partial [Candidatus Poribacteria bacterium]|nr:anaerobic glycerol-3-phosphate dehydrogenase subunit C [Candidatus Poribacteria bacterium]